jgi:hypothetical protein
MITEKVWYRDTECKTMTRAFTHVAVSALLCKLQLQPPPPPPPPHPWLGSGVVFF